MSPKGVSVDLSPFIQTLADGVSAALRELLGIPAHLPFAWHDKRVKPWRMEVKVGDLDLRLREVEPALFAGASRVCIPRCGPRGAALLVRRLRRQIGMAPRSTLRAASQRGGPSR
jgi:hypothetical protein